MWSAIRVAGMNLPYSRAVQLSGWYSTISTMWPSESFTLKFLFLVWPFCTEPLSPINSMPLDFRYVYIPSALSV